MAKSLELSLVFEKIVESMSISSWRYGELTLDIEEVVSPDGGLALVMLHAKKVANYLRLGRFFERYSVKADPTGLFEMVLEENRYMPRTPIAPVLLVLEDVVFLASELTKDPSVLQFRVLDSIPSSHLQEKLSQRTLGVAEQFHAPTNA